MWTQKICYFPILNKHLKQSQIIIYYVELRQSHLFTGLAKMELKYSIINFNVYFYYVRKYITNSALKAYYRHLTCTHMHTHIHKIVSYQLTIKYSCCSYDYIKIG